MSLINKLFKRKRTPEKKPAGKAAKPASVRKAAPKKKTAFDASVLIAPQFTEKAGLGEKSGRYVFKVGPKDDKIAVAKAVSGVYGVKVSGVNIVNVPKKRRRVLGKSGFKTGYKKAIVKLAKGETMELRPPAAS